MLAERLKLSVTPTFKQASGRPGRGAGRNALLAVLAVCVLSSGAGSGMAQTAPAQPPSASRAPVAPGKMTFASAEAAYDHGISALHSGRPELAINPLEYAAERDHTLAQFYLASRIYADNALPFTDHGRAFKLYQKIADEHTDIDPDDDMLVLIVAKSFTALASYLKSGIPAIGLRPDLQRAAGYLHHAATSLRDDDAQFELAKILLKGEGVEENPRDALLWLDLLSAEKGHTGAQAFLADLYWRGKHVKRDPQKALALITLAVRNAPSSERIWIEDKYQNIFCGAGEGVRRQADVMVADWNTKYGRQTTERVARDGLSVIQPQAERTCGNGEPVTSVVPQPARRGDVRAQTNTATQPMPSGMLSLSPNGLNAIQGNTFGFGLRDAGQTTTTPPR